MAEAGAPAKQAQPAGERGAIGKAQKGKRTQATGPAYVEIAAHNPRKGPKHAKVTLVEFTDFQ